MPSDSDTKRSTGCLLVVGGRPDTVRKAAELGLDVVLLQHKDHFAQETLEFATAVIVADYTDWASTEPLVIAAQKAYGFTAVVSLTEPGLEPAGRINDLLGFGGNTFDVSRVLRNKLEMRRHLVAAGGSAAASSVPAADAIDEEALLAFGAQHGYPFIVKPANLTASVGVHKVDRPEQVPKVWRAVEELQRGIDGPWGKFFGSPSHMIEEYLEGPEYSVEAFSFDGRHVVVAVTEKLVADSGFIEMGHAQPARVDAATRSDLASCATAFLEAIGQRQGASHTEIKLTPQGPRIVEGHNRIGGDRIVDLLELTYGIDFELLTVAWPFALVDPLPDDPPASGAAATQFFPGCVGVVSEILGAEEVRDHPAVFALDLTVKVGDTIHPQSNWDRAGQVVVAAEDTDTAVGLCADLASKIEIRVDPEPEGALSSQGSPP